jgi:flavin-dependent dehydrogenase
MTGEHVEFVVVGAGPAGLRAAQVLAEAGREVLVLERNERIGPKTCAGGLSDKAVRELRALGLPAHVGRSAVVHASFQGEPPTRLDPEHARIRTLSRERLGAYQAQWTLAAGAEVRIATAASKIDPTMRTITCAGRLLRYRHLIGADGSGSTVRRALGLPSSRGLFAGEFNVPAHHASELVVEFDAGALANGYFWVFPHEEYTSIGAGGHKSKVRPAGIRPYLQQRMAALRIDPGTTPYEGAAIEIDFRGFHFSYGVHLVGDAAGTPSGLTAEGIYPALITGEEVVRQILEPRFPMPKTRAWLRAKRLHDAIGRIWLRRMPLELSIGAMHTLCRHPIGRRWISTLLLEAG